MFGHLYAGPRFKLLWRAAFMKQDTMSEESKKHLSTIEVISLGFVEMEQRVEGLLDSFTDLKNPDFSKLTDACGLDAWRVENSRDLESAMRKWLDADGPALLDVKVNRMELVMPPKVKASQVFSTAMFSMKAVLDGRTKEVVSLLRDNFIK